MRAPPLSSPWALGLASLALLSGRRRGTADLARSAHDALVPVADRIVVERIAVGQSTTTTSTHRPDLCVETLVPFEPHVPWNRSFLAHRADCYRRFDHPLAARAARELEEYVAAAPPELAERLAPPAPRQMGSR